jgi:hypothetical protein
MSGALLEIVIVGTVASERTFRPADWAERQRGVLSVCGEDRQLCYSPYRTPITLRDRVRGVVVRRERASIDPPARGFALAFVSDQEPTPRDGRTELWPEPTGAALAGAAS